MSTSRKTGLISAVLALLAIALLTILLTEGVILPRPIQGDVLRVHLLQLQPAEQGARALFQLSNEHGPQVDLWAVRVQEPAGSRDLPISPVTLARGETTQLEIDVPRGRWQTLFYVNRHPRTRWKNGTIVYSDWIESDASIPRQNPSP